MLKQLMMKVHSAKYRLKLHSQWQLLLLIKKENKSIHKGKKGIIVSKIHLHMLHSEV